MARKKTGSKSKKNSILNFVAVVILTIVGLVLSFASFDVPLVSGGYWHYNGFANSISLGLDLAGGISVVYDCGDAEDKAIEATKTRLENLIGAEYSEMTIQRSGSKILIEVPSVTDADEIFALIGTPMPLSMTTTEGANAEARIVGTDISDVYADYQNDSYGVTVRFNSEGTRKFRELTSEVSSNGSSEGTIYIYFGDIDDSADLRLTCSTTISNGSTFISGSFEDLKAAQDYALQIMSGTFSATLTLESSNIVSATLGANALKYCIIGGIVGLILIMAILWLRYGDFGLLASFALVIYIILMLFFLQAIPFVQLTLPGLAGIVLSIGMAVDGTVIIFEKTREEYRSGKKIPLSAKMGFKRSFWPIFDSNITTIFTAIVLYILGTASIKGFAITLLIGILLSMFMNLVVLRFFVKWYLPFNSVKGKKLHLPKQTRVFKDENEVVVEEVEARVGGQTNE